MLDLALIVLFVLGWLLLNRYLFPKLGIRT